MTLRVLVAEAQLLAQKVIRAMLQQLDCQFAVVSTGGEVLTLLQQQTYDVVLLNLHLPDISGLVVMRHLKQQEQQSCPWLIAMVSNVIEDDDLPTYLNSGIDDFLLKPLQLVQLKQALSQYKKSVRPAAVVASSAINLEALYQFSQELVGTQKRDQVTFIADLIETYAISTIKLISTLQRQGNETDKKNLYLAVHTLKSASASVHAQQLAHLCQCLEVLINQDGTDVTDWINRVLKEYAQVQLELTRELQVWGIEIQGWEQQFLSPAESTTK